nr:uncharacterized protein LOC107383104 [Nothobranchius furzeri]
MAEASSFLLRFLILSLLAVGRSQATNTSSSENPENEAANAPTDVPPVDALTPNGTNDYNSTASPSVSPPKEKPSNVSDPGDQASNEPQQEAAAEDSEDDLAQLPRSCLPHGNQKLVCPTQGPLEFVCPTPEPQQLTCPPQVPATPKHKPVSLQLSQLLKLIKQLGYSPDGPQQQQQLEQEQNQEKLLGLLSKWLQELQQRVYLQKLKSMAHQQGYLPMWRRDDYQYHGYQLPEPGDHDVGPRQHYGYPPQEPLHQSHAPRKFRENQIHGYPLQKPQTPMANEFKPPHSHDNPPQEFLQPSPQSYPPRGSMEPRLQSHPPQDFWDVPPQMYPQREFLQPHPYVYPALELWGHNPQEYPPQEFRPPQPTSLSPQEFHKPHQHGHPQVPTKPQMPHQHHKRSFKPLPSQIITRWPAYLPQKPYYITNLLRYQPKRPQNKPRPGNPPQMFYLKAK